MKNKKEASIVTILLIFVILSLLMFDFSFTWIKELTFQSMFLIVLTIIYSILLLRILKEINQSENFFERLIFIIISFQLVLFSNIDYDGTRSNNLLDNLVFPIVIFFGCISSLILLLKRCTKNKNQSEDSSLIDKEDSSED